MLSHLGDTQRAIGNPQEARDSWRQALAILDASHDPGAGEVRAKLRGLAWPRGETAVTSAWPGPGPSPAASVVLAGAEGGPDAD